MPDTIFSKATIRATNNFGTCPVLQCIAS